MQKHPKQAFGIFEDGHSIRLAHIIHANDQYYLDSVDRVELEKPIYHAPEEKPLQDLDLDSMDEAPDDDNLKLDDYSPDLGTNMQLSPSDNLFAAHPLRSGVIALNVNDEYIHRVTENIPKPNNLKRFIRDLIPADMYRKGLWESSYVKVGEHKELWVSHGVNLLLDYIQSYEKRSKLHLYYQLADANDIALTDYFRTLIAGIEKRILLVYLGEDYRKIFVFENGIWVDTLPIQITQKRPEPEIIYSKLALAIDSSSYPDPEVIAFCGDLVNEEILAYLRSQFENTELDFLGFPQLVVESERTELYDKSHLAHYAVPIALALKALTPDDPYYNKSNFLPSSVVEGQKVFKIAWHGFIVLILVFLATMFFTNTLLKETSLNKKAKRNNAELSKTLAQRRIEAKEIQEIRANLEKHQKSIEAMQLVLDKKNPWSYLLELINRKLGSNRISWLNNMSVDKGKLHLAGVTTNRSNVVDFADMLPNCQIRKVTHSKIRSVDLWQFELISDLPEVDWMAVIEEDLARLMALKQSYGEQSGSGAPGSEQTNSNTLRPFPPQLLLAAKPEQVSSNDAAVRAYNEFIASTLTSNIWQYREKGQGFLQRFRNHPLGPIVRWRTAYRLYIDKEYDFASQYLNPMLQNRDEYYSYAVLLAARIEHAKGSDRFREYYRIMRNDFSRSPLNLIVIEDMRILGL